MSRGGSSDISNTVISCRPCNDSKADKLLEEWDIRPQAPDAVTLIKREGPEQLPLLKAS